MIKGNVWTLEQTINKKWDIYFLVEALLISTRSKDPSTQVGAIIVKPDKRIVSKGYNGLPSEMEDDYIHYNNRELKYDTIIHAEENALIFAKQDLDDCILYTWPFLPCSRCASKMIQAGIKRIVAPRNDVERWEKNLSLSKKSLTECGIAITEYPKRNVLNELEYVVGMTRCKIT